MSIFSFQSLLLLNYLLKNASENVVLKTREHLLDDLRSLATYSCFDERGRDQGEQIRLKAKEIIDFIQLDDESLKKRKKERKKRKKVGNILDFPMRANSVGRNILEETRCICIHRQV